MYSIRIKTYRPSAATPEHVVYVLSKGNNAGKPLDKACPNCFTIYTSSQFDHHTVYWTCYMLWKTGMLKHMLVGSVVPFIRINDLRHAIESAMAIASADQSSFEKMIDVLEQLSLLEHSVLQQLTKLRELKSMFAHSFRKITF